MPSYTASGGLKVGICSKYWMTKNYPYKWRPGDVLFSKQKALVGQFEKVAIKDVRIIMNQSTTGKLFFIYVDSLNSLWNENDLVQEYDALLMAKMYYEKKIAETVSASYCCNL